MGRLSLDEPMNNLGLAFDTMLSPQIPPLSALFRIGSGDHDSQNPLVHLLAQPPILHRARWKIKALVSCSRSCILGKLNPPPLQADRFKQSETQVLPSE